MSELKPLTEAETTELLDWVSACQSSYHIDSTPGHRFGGLGSNLQENRESLVEYVNELIAARAQPAQAGQVLTDDEVALVVADCAASAHRQDDFSFARAIEQAVLAKRVPMTEAEMLAAFAVAHPQDHADMQDGSPANAVERIGARNVYRRFERGIRAAERHHGIVGEKGGA